MFAFLTRRLAAGVLTLLAIATLSFFIVRFAPGNPFSSEKNVSPEVLRNIERRYGLDRPLSGQYWTMLSGYVRGDLGLSYRSPSSVSELVWPKFAVSVRLGGIAFALALAGGLFLGLVACARQNRWPDHAATSIATLGICVPNFLLAPLLIILFYYVLGWLDPAGWPGDWTSWTELRKLILPAVSLALVHVAYLSRLVRAGMLDVLHRDFIRTARAKGLGEFAVFLKHALKNGAGPALTYSGPMAAYIITGSIVVEQIFVIPGLGTEFVNSALNRDYPLLMGTVLIYSALVILFNLLVDAFYAVLDPRVKVS